MVGLIPLFAVETLEPEIIDRLPGFKRRCSGSSTTSDVPVHIENDAAFGARMRSCCRWQSETTKACFVRMLDETEFLSPYGIRALSRYHQDHPYEVFVMAMSAAWIMSRRSRRRCFG